MKATEFGIHEIIRSKYAKTLRSSVDEALPQIDNGFAMMALFNEFLVWQSSVRKNGSENGLAYYYLEYDEPLRLVLAAQIVKN